MVVAAQDRVFSTAHPNIGNPAGTGCDRRSAARFPDPPGPGPAAANGGEDHGLCGKGRARDGFGAPTGPHWPTPPLTDPASAFLQAIRVRLAPFAGFVVEEIRSRSWASVTFRGARHELAFRLEGEGAEESAGRFLSSLDARNFRLRGHLVADVSLVTEERRPGLARIRVEALTVEER
jgi:hypothetical protein